MFASGNDIKPKKTEVARKKYSHMMLGKREDNRTSIFQSKPKEMDHRHVDFVNDAGDIMLNSTGMLRKTELTRMMSLLGDNISGGKPNNNFCKSIQRNEGDIHEWMKQSDDKVKIASFGKMWSGVESSRANEEIKHFEPESMVNFEKETSQVGDPPKFKNNLCSHQFSEGSKHSLTSDMELSFNEFSRLGIKKNKQNLQRARKLFTTKVNLNDIYSEENGFLKQAVKKIPEAAEESESSRPSKMKDGSDSMYISELNDNNSKDRLLLKVLMEKSGKKVNINTINTNFNTVNNNNNNLNYISNQNSQGVCSSEIQFVKYLNNIKNYYVDPISKAIFLKIGAEEEEEVNKREENVKVNVENQNTQLIPLINFMNPANLNEEADLNNLPSNVILTINLMKFVNLK